MSILIFHQRGGFTLLKPTFSFDEAKLGIFKKLMLEIPASVEKVRTFSIKNLEGEILPMGLPLEPG